MVTARGTAEAFKRGCFICLSLFFFLLPADKLSAQETTVSARKFYLQADPLKLDLQLDSLFSRRALDAIASGLVTSVIMELRLDSNRRARVLEYVLAMRLEHDIWEGQYHVIRSTNHQPDTLRTTNFDTVKTYCSSLKNIALGNLPTTGRNFKLQLRVSVTPISVEQEQRTRRWLNVLQRGSLLELFFSLDRPSERTRWIEVGQFSPEDLQ